jgi:hypothetical protein
LHAFSLLNTTAYYALTHPQNHQAVTIVNELDAKWFPAAELLCLMFRPTEISVLDISVDKPNFRHEILLMNLRINDQKKTGETFVPPNSIAMAHQSIANY